MDGTNGDNLRTPEIYVPFDGADLIFNFQGPLILLLSTNFVYIQNK